jgi:hypothetical protein
MQAVLQKTLEEIKEGKPINSKAGPQLKRYRDSKMIAQSTKTLSNSILPLGKVLDLLENSVMTGHICHSQKYTFINF